MTESKKHYEALDGLRAYACIGIVMMHVLVNAKFLLVGFAFEALIPAFTYFVFLFMVISGFGMCCGYFNKVIEGKIDFVDFYKKRYKKILPFFALLSFIDLALSPSIDAFYEVIANITLCFGLIPNANISVIGVGWFLGVVFVFYLIFPFYCFLLASKVRAWVAFAVSFFINYLCRTYFNANGKTFAYAFVYFMAGGLIYIYREELQSAKVKWISLVIFAISVVMRFVFPDIQTFSLTLDSSLVVFAINLSGKNFLNNKFTKFIGGLSFEIYLCHMVVYRVVEKLHLLRLFEFEPFNYEAVVIIVFAGAVLFAFVGQQFTNRLVSFVEGKVKK